MHHIDRTKAPQTHSIDDIQLLLPEKQTLANGVPVFYFPNFQLDLIHFIIHIQTGILYEQVKHSALYTYALLKESSAAHSANEIADLFDFYGTHYTISETLDKITISISIPKNNIPKILPIIFNFLLHPQYREENLTIYKNLKIKDLEYNTKKTDFRATQWMLHAMFGDAHTAGQCSNRENILAVNIDQMLDFHQSTFCAENIRLFATGNLDADIKQCIEDLFSSIPNGHASTPIPLIKMPDEKNPIIHEAMPDSVQSSITLCAPSLGYNDAERRDFSILSTILGGYFGSRLMQNLRERNGYTYGVSAGSVYFGKQSLFIINSDVNREQTDLAVKACFEEMQRLQEEPIDMDELTTVQNYIIGDMLRDIDNSVAYLKKYVFWNHFGLNEEEFHTMLHHVRLIDAERLKTLAEKQLENNKFTQIIVG